MSNDFNYLAKRAELFLKFLDSNNITDVFPERNKSWADLKLHIKSGNIRKLKILNDMIDNIIIGKSSLSINTRFKILDLFYKNLNEEKTFLIDKKNKLFHKIIGKGIIDSRLMLNDAIAIQNSEILGLDQKEKNKLKEIILLSMQKRIEKNKNAS